MEQKGYSISFKTINYHALNDFKTNFGKIILSEIKKKKINTGDLQRQIKSFGYNYPIYRVLKNDSTITYPIELYCILIVLVGIDIFLVPNEDVNNSKKYIKNRYKIRQQEELNN